MALQQEQVSEFRFIGTGTQYFGVWIVNLLLTIITLGIFSAWAKVRRQQFFYQHTLLDDHRFDYTGNPVSILIGRIIAVGVIAFQSATKAFSPTLAVLLAIVIFFLFPWLIKQTFVFTARNSRYRNIRFRYTGSTVGAVVVYVLWPILAIFSLGLLTPFSYYAHKKYFFDQMNFGRHKVRLNITVGQVYRVFFKTSLLFFAIFFVCILIIVGVAGIDNVMTNSVHASPRVKAMIGLTAPILLFGTIVTFTFFQVQMTNLIWSNTRIANSYVRSNISTVSMLWISITNWVLLSITAGLFYPWAKVRVTKYRLENMGVIWRDDPETLMGAGQDDISATGEEVADFLGFDLSL